MLNTHFVFDVKIGAFDHQGFSHWGETNLGSDQLGMEDSGEAVDDDGSGWFEVKKVFIFVYVFILFLAWVFFFSSITN